jgi:CO/xanthine dehydrogenase FAD-binding subunit
MPEYRNFLGNRITESLIEKASQQVALEIQAITDLRSTAWYWKEVSKVLVKNAVDLVS